MSEAEAVEAMVDLETFGNNKKAVILSIGACKFFPNGTGMLEKFEVFVDPQSCIDIGMQMDASTVMWWMDDQRNEARAVLMGNMENAVPIKHALHMFISWLGADRPIWGNGATFDNVILRSAYELAGIPCPWKFWNDRCYRTMKANTPSVKMQREGVHHSAMWDAVSQAKHLQAINRFNSTSGE